MNDTTATRAPLKAPSKAPLNWPAAILFSLTTLLVLTLLPWYAWTHDFSVAAWGFFAFVGIATAMSITGGYHRLWSHRAYEAHPLLKLGYMLFGAMALQNSILVWSAMHRVHHAHVDDEDRDPYSIRRGLWYAHMGWMVRNYPCHQLDYSNAKDLLADPIVMFQHRHYLTIALAMNIAFPLAVGALFGDAWGFLMLGGLLRLVLNHHFTFFINSLAHYWGRRPYTTDNSARDNDLLALFTFGEGYHNYHHLFQWDYRNGIRWWMFDPTKWLIVLAERIGLAGNLRRVPEFAIQRAMLERQFKNAREQLDRCQNPGRLASLHALLQHELEAFSATVAEFRQLQTEKLESARRQLADQWEHSELRRRLQTLEQALEVALRQQRERVRLLSLQTAAV